MLKLVSGLHLSIHANVVMNLIRKPAIVIIVLGSVAVAQADIIDFGITSLDTSTGLEWLDVNQSNQFSFGNR